MKDSPADLLEALKRSLVAIKQLKERVRELESASHDVNRFVGSHEPIAIAIVGIGCRFAGGVSSPDTFWKLLDEGIDAVGPVPRDRWNARDRDSVYEGGFLTGDVFGFDASFFGIPPREALGMDPQQRLLMEVVWESLEHAGILPESVMGSATGVFVGTNIQEYTALQSTEPQHANMLDGYALTGVHPSVASGRLSYFLGAKGPSITLDTACSSSLVAVHYACQSLRSRECEMAIAGGAGILLSPSAFVEFSRLQGLAKNGRSKAFDASADGMGLGEGCGVVVLKRLSSAESAGDRVLAVIRGSAVNQDGHRQGLTVPNGLSQRELIAQALERAGALPAEIAYVEAQGTGTELGDPIEMQALGKALAAGRLCSSSSSDDDDDDDDDDDPKIPPLLVGSVKTNIGHTMAAAGVAGLIKTVLALGHERIPKSLHFTTPSPHIPWDALPVRVVTESTPWPRAVNGNQRRVAGVSSLGASGTNAHVVVEEAPPRAPAPPPATATQKKKDRTAHILVVSAKTRDALVLQAERYAEHLETRTDIALADLCHAAATTRTHFEERLFVVAASKEEAIKKLRARARARPKLEGVIVVGTAPEGDRPKVAFLFLGRQSSSRAEMMEPLYESEPVFREALDKCAHAHVLDSEDARLFAMEYALAALWQSWGIVPDVVMGRGVGELVAACLAGVFRLEDALSLLDPKLDRKIERHPPSSRMTLVAIAEDEAEEGVTTRAHWQRHVPAASRVRLEEGMNAIRALGVDTFVDVLPSQKEDEPPFSILLLLLESLGRLYVRGAKIAWSAFDAPFARERVSAPTYAFDRKTYRRDEAERSIVREQREDKSPQQQQLVVRGAMSDEHWRTRLLDLVRTETAVVLSLPDPASLRVDRTLFQLGLDSIHATTLRNRLKTITGVLLPSKPVFEHPTVDAIAKLLAQALAEANAEPVVATPAAPLPYEEFDL